MDSCISSESFKWNCIDEKTEKNEEAVNSHYCVRYALTLYTLYRREIKKKRAVVAPTTDSNTKIVSTFNILFCFRFGFRYIIINVFHSHTVLLRVNCMCAVSNFTLFFNFTLLIYWTIVAALNIYIYVHIFYICLLFRSFIRLSSDNMILFDNSRPHIWCVVCALCILYCYCIVLYGIVGKKKLFQEFIYTRLHEYAFLNTPNIKWIVNEIELVLGFWFSGQKCADVNSFFFLIYCTNDALSIINFELKTSQLIRSQFVYQFCNIILIGSSYTIVNGFCYCWCAADDLPFFSPSSFIYIRILITYMSYLITLVFVLFCVLYDKY